MHNLGVAAQPRANQDFPVNAVASSMAGQYDRALRCLEQRLAASDVTRASSLRQRIRDAVRDQLRRPAGVAFTDHLALLELSRSAEGASCRLTTNFRHPLRARLGRVRF